MAGYGFTPVKHLAGGTIRTVEYKILDAYAANLFTGDHVILHTDGTINVGSATSSTNIGVFGGCKYTNTDGEIVYNRMWPTATVSTDAVAYVWDDPNILYQCQADQDSTALLSTDIGDGFRVVATAGSTVTKQSGFVLDSSTNGTVFRFVDPATSDGAYTASGTTMDVYVRFLDHLHIAATAVA